MIQRKTEKSTLARNERQGMKARDIRLKYPDSQKSETLINSLRRRGLWYFDPDFPQDEEDWFECLLNFTLNFGGHVINASLVTL